MNRHSLDYDLPIGNEIIPLAISYTIESGYAGDDVNPPEPTSAEILKIEVVTSDGKEIAPRWLTAIVDRDEDINELMIDAVGPDPDYERDLRREAA